MKQQIIYIHGGIPKENYNNFLSSVESIEYNPYEEKNKRWRSSIEAELWEYCELIVPSMPNRVYADYAAWKVMFEKLLPYLRDDVIFIGHSLGSCFLFKYLSENKLSVSIKAFFSVGGAIHDNDLELLGSFTPDIQKINDTWAEQLYLIHSRDDAVVPFSDFEVLDQHLSGHQTMVFEDRGHFIGEEFPEIIEELKKIL